MKKTTEEIAAKIKELVDAGKTDIEVMNEMDAFIDSEDEEPSDKDDPKVPVEKQLPKDDLKRPVKSKIKAFKDKSEDNLRVIAAETADNLREFNVMNGLAEGDDEALFEACEKIYAWLYDQAWMEPKDGWKVESKIKADEDDGGEKLPEDVKGDTFTKVADAVDDCHTQLSGAIMAMDEEEEKRDFTEYERNAYNAIDKALESLDEAESNLSM